MPMPRIKLDADATQPDASRQRSVNDASVGGTAQPDSVNSGRPAAQRNPTA
jgi:hypothetical protein